ncbi:hypothetical protein N7517_006479 [Penicillium concentricum]|uniref:Uncharacterized protein n=1 Tax=Penicillium concentricum TaxID=293559 RepID=A0A9W9SE50_9EURO|nr:uncharacterized protein N7517_006479 [Penicillium concentricum]KAJ5374473.1 hypothetical protein N7517_006479 [Penicillium concentricum]
MKLLCAILCMGSALASLIPHSNSRQLRLPYVPSPDDLEFGVTWKLAMNFSIQNGGLYANKHQVYPPSATMQLQAPLYEGASQNIHNGKIVKLAYSLETQTIHKNEMGTIADMTLVRVEFLDLQGNLISPHAVAIHLHVCQDGNYEMARFRIEPARTGNQDDHFSQKSQAWVMKYWISQFGNIFNKIENKAPAPNSALVTKPSALRDNSKIVSSEVVTSSGSKTQFLPVWSTPAVLNHRLEYGRPYGNPEPISPFMRIVCYIVLAFLGIVIGVMTCLVGFLAGHLLIALGAGVEWRKLLGRRSRIMLLEEGTVSEKSPMISHVYMTDASELNV